MFGKFSKSAEEALAIAKQKALELGHNYIGTEHIILGLLEQKESVAAKVLGLQQITAEEVETKIEELVGVGEEEEVDAQDFTPRTKKVLESSIRQAIRFGQSYTGTEHVLLSIIEEPNCVAVKILISLDANLQKIYEDIFEMLSGVKKGSDLEKIYTGDPMNKNDLYTFEKYSTDITKLAEENKLDPVIGREKEIERVIQILSRRTKNNPCLIGEPGVGKTAIVEGLAQLIVSGSVPETLKHKRILALDISAMVAGTKYRGEFESRIKKVIEEIKNNSNVIMFIDEIHMIIGAGSAEGSLDAANILKPSLARGELHVIGATTTDEYRKHVEKDKALERRFQPVKVEEPSEEEAIKILKGLRDKYEAHHEVKIKDSAIEAAVKLSIRYLSDRALPDKAVDVIDEASSKVKLKSMTMPDHVKEIEQKIQSLNDEKENLIKLEEYEKAGEIKKKQDVLKKKLEDVKEKWKRDLQDSIYTVTEKEVAEVIEQWTGIPVTKLEEGESQRLAKLESLLKERIIGQEEALKAVGAAIRRGRVGIKDPKRPIGSFLFLGPTGVGKTELTKALADVMFGDEKFMVRVDMSEYMEKHNVSKLIGSPPGYVGYDEGGQLTEIIRRKPYSVILFDEIEKAHPDVFNIMLQILDDGHITDSQGRKVDFKNTVIIMTSNIGARDIIEPKRLGFNNAANGDIEYKDMKKNVMDKLKDTFKPEFLNRIDEIIVFHPLTRENIKAIVKILFKGLEAKIKENVRVTLKLDENVLEFIAKEGYDQKYGARPLKRAIQTKIEDRLAEKILDGKIKAGGVVTVSAKDDELDFKIKNSSKKEVEEK